MAKNNLLGTCPYCGSLYFMDEDNDRGYCGRTECAKKAGDLKTVERRLTDGGKIVEFTKTGKEQKVEEKPTTKNKVVVKSLTEEFKNAKKAKTKRKTTKVKSKKTKSRRVSK